MLVLTFFFMRFFWPLYLFAAVVGTVGVYYIAPIARPYVPEFLKLQLHAEQEEGSRSAADLPAIEQPFLQESTTTAPTSTTRPAPKSDEDDELPPILNGIHLAQKSDKREWGITHQAANYYAANGTRLGAIEAGTLVQYCGTQASSKGAMVECLLKSTNVAVDPVLISAADLYIFTGDYRKLSTRQLTDLKTYYALSGKIAQRKKELLQISASRNPYFQEYQARHKQLMDHIEKAKVLAKERDKTTSGNHIEIEDQLRSMKHQESQLNRHYQEIHEKFRAWKDAHAAELPQPDKDSAIVQWVAEKSELFTRIPGLAY